MKISKEVLHHMQCPKCQGWWTVGDAPDRPHWFCTWCGEMLTPPTGGKEGGMINWTDEQLEEAGIDKARLKSVVARFRRLSREMAEMGLHVYGQSGTGHLIHYSRPTHGGDGFCGADVGSSVAGIGDGYDGGDW